MKNTYSIAQRNAIVEEHLACIDKVMRRNRKLIRDARLDPDDVYQELALRLVKAVSGFDPEKGDLETHIMAQLQYAVLNCMSPSRRLGITDAPRGMGDKIVSFEAYRDRAERHEMALAA